MTRSDLIALLPLAITMITAVAVAVQISVRRIHIVSLIMTLAGLTLAIASLAPAWLMTPRPVADILIIDGYAIFYMGLILLSTFAVALLAFTYLERRSEHREEFYVLLLCATLGTLALAASDHFVTFFLGMELLSVSLFGMIGYQHRSATNLEAAIKYLILAGVSSATLLFGMALVYADRGTMHFSQIMAGWPVGTSLDWLMLTGLAMIIVGFGFKLALVPFHLWTPDVYQGASAPVTAFIATISKGAMFALLLRFFTRIDLQIHPSLFIVFYIIAIASMFTGNLLALRQDNVKRLLAYSSIAHLGYLLVAFLAAQPLATVAVTFYLVAYFVTTLGAFGVVTVLSPADRDADQIDDYRGLAQRRPWLTVVFTTMLLSLAGIPLTAGFIGKFYVLAAGMNSALTSLVIILVINSAIGLYYYLRLVAALYSSPPQAASERATGTAASTPAGAQLVSIAWTGYLAVAVMAVLVLLLGIYPSPAIRVLQSVIGTYAH